LLNNPDPHTHEDQSANIAQKTGGVHPITQAGLPPAGPLMSNDIPPAFDRALDNSRLLGAQAYRAKQSADNSVAAVAQAAKHGGRSAGVRLAA
jgi:hypothetical protein